MSVPVPFIEIANLDSLYIQNLNISWLTTTTMSLSFGQCRDSTNQNDIVVSSAAAGSVTINAAVVGANGIDTGTLGVSTLYNVFAIGDSRQFNPGAGIISAAATPNLPFGYDMYRRVGSVLTDGASHLLDFSSVGHDLDRWYWYAAAQATGVVGGNQTAFTAINLGAMLPISATQAILKVAYTPTTAGNICAFREHGSSSAAGQVMVSGDVAAVVHTVSLQCPVLVVAGVPECDYKVAAGGDAVTVSVFGYIDSL